MTSLRRTADSRHPGLVRDVSGLLESARRASVRAVSERGGLLLDPGRRKRGEAVGSGFPVRHGGCARRLRTRFTPRR